MKTTLILIALLFAASVVFAEGKLQTTCPVMTGNAVDSNSAYVDVEGYRIYVCCAGCIDAIKANPEKYIEKMKAEGIEIEKAPVAPSENAPVPDSQHSGVNHEGHGH
jgi:hypothetical protein